MGERKELTKGDNDVNRAFRIGLFLSSYTPVAIMIFLNDMKEFSLEQVGITLHKNTVFWSVLTGVFILSLLTLIFWLVRMARNAQKQVKLYEIYDIKSNDGEVLSYFVTFVIPILSLKVDSAPSIVMNVMIIALVGIYFVQNNVLHFNPLLLLAGYHIYSDSADHIIISRCDKYTIKNKGLKADQFGSSNIFYIKKPKP